MTRLATIPVLLMLSSAACWAQDDIEGDQPERRVAVTVAPLAMQRNVAGRWATLAVNTANLTDSDVEETVAVSVGDSSVQFARRLWVPAGARRQAWLPIQIPSALLPSDKQVMLNAMRLNESAAGEQFQLDVVGAPITERSMLVSWEESRGAVLLAPFDRDDVAGAQTQQLMQMVYAARDSSVGGMQDLGLVQILNDLLPPTRNALDALDQIVIANDRILNDSAATSLLQRWLRGGGRMWVMIDQMEPDAVRKLLGDAACYGVVDRVELNEFEFENAVSGSLESKTETEAWSSDRPVQMLRVFAEADEVTCRINGWPAAFWKQVGRGQVLFTTLGARGWLHDHSLQPTNILRDLSEDFFESRDQPPEHTAAAIEFLGDEIGYQIPSRSLVASMLGIHVLILLGIGGWLASRRNLHRMALIIPLASILAAGLLIAIGRAKTKSVPSTIATAQIAKVASSNFALEVDTVTAMYSQERFDINTDWPSDTSAMLHEQSADGAMKRLMWSDDGSSRWMFVTQPSGVVRHVTSQSTVALPSEWAVRGTFTDEGFRAKITGLDADKCSDLVVVSAANPSLGMHSSKDHPGVFVGGVDQVLPRDQYLDAALMSDAQRRRQALVRRLSSAENSLETEPTLLLWTDPINVGAKPDDSFVRRGSALVSLPIQFQRGEGNTSFQVPASFVRIVDRGASTMFNARTGRWLDEMNRPNKTQLRFLVPRVLLPCKLTRADVSIKINAPSRRLDVSRIVDGKDVTLLRRENPIRLIQFAIKRPESLELDEQGGLPITVAVSDTIDDSEEAGVGDDDRKPSRNTWQIEYVRVNLFGETE